MIRLARSVYGIEKRGGESRIVRAFPADRPVERVQGDAKIRRFLEKEGFHAERIGGHGVI
jgi:hypothetical protein